MTGPSRDCMCPTRPQPWTAKTDPPPRSRRQSGCSVGKPVNVRSANRRFAFSPACTGHSLFLRLAFCSVRHHEKSHLAIAVSIRIDNSCDGLLTDVLVISGQYIYVRNRFKLRTCVAIACVHARRSLRYRRDLGTKASKQHVCPAARGRAMVNRGVILTKLCDFNCFVAGRRHIRVDHAGVAALSGRRAA